MSGVLSPRDAARVDSVVAAVDALRERIEGTALADEVAAEGRLHPLAARRSLTDWAASIERAALTRLVSGARTEPRSDDAPPVLTLASGNVPVVAAEAVLLAVLAGGRHQIALSTRAGALARATLESLTMADAERARLVELFAWRSLSAPEQLEVLARAGRVVVYGSADTVEWIAERARHARIVPHGPSIAVAVARAPGPDGDALRRLARDVATWEQRGCRSPHALVLLEASPDEVEAAAADLARALAQEATRLPPTPADRDELALRYLDRLTSEQLGAVHSGPGYTVSAEASARALRVSPLGRTVRVVGARDVAEAARLVGTLPAPCNLLLTLDGAALEGLAAPEVAAFGGGQGAGFDRRHDGMHRLDSLR